MYHECELVQRYVLIPMWWGGFSELLVLLKYWSRWLVLIPMWWGGFSEFIDNKAFGKSYSLNPHVVGRFFRALKPLMLDGCQVS